MKYKKVELADELIEKFLHNQTNENFADLIDCLINSKVYLINKDIDNTLKKLNNMGITPLVITDSEKKNYIPLFTTDSQIINDEIKKYEKIEDDFKELCNDSIITNEYIEGFVLNPFTHGLKIPKEVIKIVIKYKENE